MIMIVHNVTPDSFYPPSRYDESVFVSGADIVDIGGCSTRPGASGVSETDEWERLEPVLRKLEPVESPCLELPQFRHRDYPGGPAFTLSIDTFRAGIARKAFGLLGAGFILNDVGGMSDRTPSLEESLVHIVEMAELCRELGLQYVATHNGPASETYSWFEAVAPLLDGVGWILDPGLGFGKNDPQENWDLLARLGDFRSFGRPILVGASHKRFVRASSDLTRKANRLAASGGAVIFRVHDVADAAF